jgi:hypothetical protein
MFKLMSSFRQTIALLAAAFTLAVWTTGSRAEDKKSFKVAVAAILASEKDEKVDDCLKRLAARVQKTEPKLKSFHVIKHSQNTLALNQSYAFPLVEDQVLKVSMERAPDDSERVGLRLKAPKMGEIFYTQKTCGRWFPIITPYVTKDNERLIIAIRVECNHNKKE